MLQLVKREEGVGYFDSHLWIPKSAASLEHIASLLTYEKDDESLVEAWEETTNHFKVPRNFMRHQALTRVPYPVYDARWTKFPSYKFESQVTLDFKEPDKTYQTDGCAALVNAFDGILSLRCGGGKTYTALHAAAQVGQPTLVIVNEKSLAKQWEASIQEALGLPKDQIGMVGGDKGRFDWQKPICIALIQTLAMRATDNRIPPEMIQHFGVTIVDEAHIAGAPFLNRAVPPFHGRRWGLSATPRREDGFDSLLTYTTGPVVYQYLLPNLRPSVVFRQLDTRLDTDDIEHFRGTHDRTGMFHHGKTYVWFAQECRERTNQIVRDITEAKSKGRQILVLSHSRDMVELLGERIEGAGVCHGGVRGEERFRRIRECNPVIAVMQVGKQALDKESLDTLFVCDLSTKQGVLQQIMGRILRIFDGKKNPVVVFYEDRYIQPFRRMANRIRQLLRRWPDSMGGRIPYKVK